MGRLIPAGTGMEFYRKIKIPDEVIERTGPEGMEGEYAPEYLVEPEHIRGCRGGVDHRGKRKVTVTRIRPSGPSSGRMTLP